MFALAKSIANPNIRVCLCVCIPSVENFELAQVLCVCDADDDHHHIRLFLNVEIIFALVVCYFILESN